MKPTLSAVAARRIALAAQGFAEPRPAEAGRRQLLKTIDRLGLLQIDSVNVVSRTHYLPLFSRLGAYPRALLEEIAWGRKADLFEYWMHEASLAPHALQPLMRWRMDDAAEGVGVWNGVARFLHSHADFIDRALAEIARRGPLSASELEIGAKGVGGWWGWSEGKRALECLFWTGQLTTATRRGTFERVYGLPEKIHPKAVREAPTPDRAEAQRQLIRIAARAQGVATEPDLRDYFRMPPADSKARVAELVEAGELVPVTVEGWDRPAYLDPAARRPRKIEARALLSPFDNLIWFRERTERLFGVRVRLEIYTPAHKRTHGYYVLPFLEREAITARVDLKAERKAGVLAVLAAHAEPGAGPDTAAALAAELRLMAGWLGLGDVRVAPKGDLAPALADALGA
ncbi:winged helix-turn-helix domain-containing protein [Phenylobacterium aquaticum]|uniref:winged helix-turn-helix domain-containing protein n=1 Tax=Phenylobacterium aquaticum TaxID=1763816 RepID=UPI001F5CD67A|nr:winged helix-turn-helix domain-containing protein [Phenylobacterium aquaticum]MCI3134289.1 winged helix-turn-helix domain-containing protein [Phenylobacterium aquaticum]